MACPHALNHEPNLFVMALLTLIVGARHSSEDAATGGFHCVAVVASTSEMAEVESDDGTVFL